jgi:two-component system, NarL family, nitrate/nitrite response regulator NarL
LSGITVMLIGFGRLFVDCLAHAAPEFRVVEAAERPDILTIDTAAMNGRALDVVRAVAPQARVIVYGIEPAHGTALQWIEAGANGYLPRDASLAELKRTVQLVANGDMPVSPEIAFALFSRLAELARAQRRTNALESMVLTPRELAVLHLIAERRANRDIAGQLSLSFHTVKNHVQNIFKKLDVTRRMDAVDRARRQGWLDE